MIKNDLVLRAARRERTERTPVWLMRQAGRTDPAYRQLRERVDLPLEQMFREPDVCLEVSLLPRRLGVDAIILFQDILTPLAPMGAEFVFRPGPILKTPLTHAKDMENLSPFDPAEKLAFVGRAIELIRGALEGSLPILGFAGAPFTLAAFLVEGRSPDSSLASVRAVMRDDPRTFHDLLNKLAEMTADYLDYQAASGADAVQLFDSLADRLTPEEYEAFAHPYHQIVFSRLRGRVPTILFAKECPRLERMAASGADVLSIGSCVDLVDARRRVGDRVALQGNIDNRLLETGSRQDIESAVQDCVHAGAQCGHILNLNHGLLKDTPFENVCCLIEAAKRTAVELTSTAMENR